MTEKGPSDVPVSAQLVRRCSSPGEAEALRRAIDPDNADYVQASVDGAFLVLRSEAAGLRELQRTLDDALACLSAAERTWETGRRGAPSPSGDEAVTERSRSAHRAK